MSNIDPPGDKHRDWQLGQEVYPGASRPFDGSGFVVEQQPTLTALPSMAHHSNIQAISGTVGASHAFEDQTSWAPSRDDTRQYTLAPVYGNNYPRGCPGAGDTLGGAHMVSGGHGTNMYSQTHSTQPFKPNTAPSWVAQYPVPGLVPGHNQGPSDLPMASPHAGDNITPIGLERHSYSGNAGTLNFGRSARHPDRTPNYLESRQAAASGKDAALSSPNDILTPSASMSITAHPGGYSGAGTYQPGEAGPSQGLSAHTTPQHQPMTGQGGYQYGSGNKTATHMGNVRIPHIGHSDYGSEPNRSQVESTLVEYRPMANAATAAEYKPRTPAGLTLLPASQGVEDSKPDLPQEAEGRVRGQRDGEWMTLISTRPSQLTPVRYTTKTDLRHISFTKYEDSPLALQKGKTEDGRDGIVSAWETLDTHYVTKPAKESERYAGGYDKKRPTYSEAISAIDVPYNKGTVTVDAAGEEMRLDGRMIVRMVIRDPVSTSQDTPSESEAGPSQSRTQSKDKGKAPAGSSSSTHHGQGVRKHHGRGRRTRKH
nr:uncharacterized protein CI109_006267 [Kwoniella shandongensis]KAA5525368.1 hypothetical protein CI109_006267 [Kwoniella shandongensis]